MCSRLSGDIQFKPSHDPYGAGLDQILIDWFSYWLNRDPTFPHEQTVARKNYAVHSEGAPAGDIWGPASSGGPMKTTSSYCMFILISILLYKMLFSIVYVCLNESRVGEGPFYFFPGLCHFSWQAWEMVEVQREYHFLLFFCLYMKTNLARVNIFSVRDFVWQYQQAFYIWTWKTKQMSNHCTFIPTKGHNGTVSVLGNSLGYRVSSVSPHGVVNFTVFPLH